MKKVPFMDRFIWRAMMDGLEGLKSGGMKLAFYGLF